MKYRVFKETFFETQRPYHSVSEIKVDIFDLVYLGRYDAVCTQIKNGANVNLRNNKNQTLLHYAILYRQEEIAKLLISSGADLDTRDEFGKTMREVLQTHNPGLYSQINKYTGDGLQLNTVQETTESQVLGVSEESGCSCIIQ